LIENGCLVNTNPATGEVISRVKCSTPQEVDALVAKANEVQESWMAMKLSDRIQLLRDALKAVEKESETFIKLIVQEMGKPIGEAREEMEGSINKKEFLDLMSKALEPEKHGNSVIVRHPLGVVVIISPWNFPVDEILLLSLPSLGSGNTGKFESVRVE
jgi:succinate-semialdehyde dehydrogenase/glutarate-semialdehyde dehydrogenase